VIIRTARGSVSSVSLHSREEALPKKKSYGIVGPRQVEAVQSEARDRREDQKEKHDVPTVSPARSAKGQERLSVGASMPDPGVVRVLVPVAKCAVR